MVEIPEHLLKRSREAMARAKGQAPPDEGGAAEAALEERAPEESAVEAAEEPAPTETEAPAPTEEAGPVVASAPSAEASPAETVPSEPARAPAIAEEPSPYPEEEQAEIAGGIKELTTSRTPKWLVAAFIVIPIFAIIYISQFSHGLRCGQAGTLQVASDGTIVECDGSALPSPGTDAKKSGPDGSALFTQNCAACHGAQGQGGIGPAFAASSGTTLLEDFPEAAAQIEFVTKGNQAFPDGWGANKKPPRGTMPPFGNTLSPEEIEAVVAFERSLAGG